MDFYAEHIRERNESVKTVKERQFTLKLSDLDMKLLEELCEEHKITKETLIENFLGDLLDGTYSNGSDERMFARQWFDRTWMAYNEEVTD